MSVELNPILLPSKFDAETIRKTVLKNIIKMITYRKYLDKEKWDEQKINKFISNNNNNIYKLKLDNYFPEKENFINNEIIIKILNQKINSINTSPNVSEFLKLYQNNYKIIVFNSISDKASQVFDNYKNIEVFEEQFLMIDLQSHHCAPDYVTLTPKEIIEFKKTYNVNLKKMKNLLYSDPIVKYLNLSKGDIIRIIRNSIQSGKSIDYRRVT